MNIKQLTQMVESIIGRNNFEWSIRKTYQAYCTETGEILATYDPQEGTLTMEDREY